MKLAVLIPASLHILGASASPLDRRADSTSSTSAAPTAALVETTISGKATTIEVALSTSAATATASTSSEPASSATATATSTATLTPSHDFPVCRDSNAKPFCLPSNNTDVYWGEAYYVTWNPDYFPLNSTITILLNWANDTRKQAWSSDPIDNKIGATAVTMEKDWLQGYTAYNMTFYAQEYDSAADTTASVYDGPTVLLMQKPAVHYQPPPATQAPTGLGLKVGLPVTLGFVVLVVLGLLIGMRKHRQIGLGNVMGRTRGYGGRQSRRQRLGLGKKKGAIALQEREILGGQQYRDEPAPPPAPRPLSEVSLGSLVNTPTEDGRNAFRAEMERQRR